MDHPHPNPSVTLVPFNKFTRRDWLDFGLYCDIRCRVQVANWRICRLRVVTIIDLLPITIIDGSAGLHTAELPVASSLWS